MSSQLQTDFARFINELERAGPCPRGQPERRKSERVPFSYLGMAAPFDGIRLPPEAAFCQVLCRNISSTGIEFLSPTKPAGEHVMIRLPHPQGHSIAVASKIVFWLDGSGNAAYPFVVGCKFVGVSEE